MSDAPFSYAVLARDISPNGKRYRIEADEAERARIAGALGLPAVGALTADLELRALAGNAISVRGAIDAVVVQTDVVTLDPLDQTVHEAVDVVLMPAGTGRPKAQKSPILVDVAGLDESDLYRNGRIDLGVVTVEHLALGLDPYPRAPGADFAGYVEDTAESDLHPFAALTELRRRSD